MHASMHATMHASMHATATMHVWAWVWVWTHTRIGIKSMLERIECSAWLLRIGRRIEGSEDTSVQVIVRLGLRCIRTQRCAERMQLAHG
jgi:hypothetical protein